MRAGEPLEQEQEGVGEPGLGLALERLGEELHRDLRRHFSVHVPAHAVGHHHEQRVAAVAVADAVLVVRARAPAAFLEDGELHRRRAPRQRPASLPIERRRLPSSDRLWTSGSFSRSSTFCSASTLCGRFR